MVAGSRAAGVNSEDILGGRLKWRRRNGDADGVPVGQAGLCRHGEYNADDWNERAVMGVGIAAVYWNDGSDTEGRSYGKPDGPNDVAVDRRVNVFLFAPGIAQIARLRTHCEHQPAESITIQS